MRRRQAPRKPLRAPCQPNTLALRSTVHSIAPAGNAPTMSTTGAGTTMSAGRTAGTVRSAVHGIATAGCTPSQGAGTMQLGTFSAGTCVSGDGYHVAAWHVPLCTVERGWAPFLTYLCVCDRPAVSLRGAQPAPKQSSMARTACSAVLQNQSPKNPPVYGGDLLAAPSSLQRPFFGVGACCCTTCRLASPRQAPWASYPGSRVPGRGSDVALSPQISPYRWARASCAPPPPAVAVAQSEPPRSSDPFFLGGAGGPLLHHLPPCVPSPGPVGPLSGLPGAWQRQRRCALAAHKPV